MKEVRLRVVRYVTGKWFNDVYRKAAGLATTCCGEPVLGFIGVALWDQAGAMP
jgi:hypothetical protein